MSNLNYSDPDESPFTSQTNWKRLETMSEEEIDLTDIPELTPEQASLGKRQAGKPSISYEVTVYGEDGSQITVVIKPPKPAG
jgi:hypothetical protein